MSLEVKHSHNTLCINWNIRKATGVSPRVQRPKNLDTLSEGRKDGCPRAKEEKRACPSSAFFILLLTSTEWMLSAHCGERRSFSLSLFQMLISFWNTVTKPPRNFVSLVTKAALSPVRWKDKINHHTSTRTPKAVRILGARKGLRQCWWPEKSTVAKGAAGPLA